MNDRNQARWVGAELEVAAGVDVEVGMRDQRSQHPAVDERDDRVVVAGENERGLPDQEQKREARPASTGEKLVHVATRVADTAVSPEKSFDQCGIAAGTPAVEVAGLPGSGTPAAGNAVKCSSG